MQPSFKVLFIGDIVGRPGRTLVINQVKAWRQAEGLDFIVANGENAAGGMGLTKALAEELLAAGLDGITLGNHVWDQRGFEKEIDSLERVCRPANLPTGAPGRPYLILEKNGFRLAIFTLLARHNMGMTTQDSYFVGEALLETLQGQADAIFVEIHAELTAEKQAHGLVFDGRVAAVVGTHTHVPTADVRILPKGTAYQTDVGMTGVRQSSIGFDPEAILAQAKDSLPRRWSVAEGATHMDGIIVEIEAKTGLAIAAKRVEWHE